MYLQFHSVKESSKKHDIWVRVLFGVGFGLVRVLAHFLLLGSGSVRFLAKPGFWFCSFLLGVGSSSYPSLPSTLKASPYLLTKSEWKSELTRVNRETVSVRLRSPMGHSSTNRARRVDYSKRLMKTMQHASAEPNRQPLHSFANVQGCDIILQKSQQISL